ncbi:MAG: hypothetical protein AAFQ67_04275 [Pseudomonadota bacterium]
MIDFITSTASGFSILCLGAAIGLAWAVAVTAPNCSYDRLDHSRADGHVRQLLVQASAPIAGLCLAGAAFSALGGVFGAAILSLVAAGGFFSNRWTLAPRKKGDAPPGVRRRRKSQRVVAVSLTLMFTAVAAVAGVLAVFGV